MTQNSEPPDPKPTDDISEEEISRWRRETPGSESVVHLNNAGASLMPGPVVNAVHQHLDLEAQIGGYEAADIRAEAIAGVYEALARLLHAHPRNIALVENATVAYSQALSSIPWREGDLILTTTCDYVSNQLMFLSLKSRFGIRILRAPDTAGGGVDAAAIETLIRDHRPRLVAVTHIPTNSGLIQDVESVGRICHDTDTLYLVDACQSAGQTPLDIRRIRCDFLTASSRKFLRGPRGTGFLFVSDRVLEEGLTPIFIDLRSAEWTSADGYDPAMTAHRFENFEFAVANLLGMGEAVHYALGVGLDRIERRARSLASFCRDTVRDLNGVRLLDQGNPLAAIVTLDLKDMDVGSVVAQLRTQSVNTSKSPRNFAVIDFDRKQVTDGALRISPHYYNTREEIESAVRALREIIGR